LRRLAVVLAVSIGVALLLATAWTSPIWTLFPRTILMGLAGLAMFALFEASPKRPPRWIERWVIQVIAVAAVIPPLTLMMYILSTPAGAPPFWQDRDRMDGWMMLTFLGILIAPWTALAAVVRQKEAFRSQFERQALEAQLQLLQAQVAPHFLFNTLANIQALVDAGSPRASEVLRSLVAYLRAAVPILNEPAATLDRELQLVKPYLELMHMRMPDRLQYAMHVDDSALGARCPPTTLLTLVENAVRHGIDPSEEGGRIDIDIRRSGERCVIRVTDTGAGLRDTSQSLGTGLAALRERLQMLFGDGATLRVTDLAPHGVAAEVEMPA
jgi:hypothetical protein